MGLKEVESLRSFCMDLSSDHPSPGGGTASAAAGAMSASLLAMVCGISGRSKKRSSHWPELSDLKVAMSRRRDILISLAQEDARSYDDLFEASRRRKTEGTADSHDVFRKALMEATRIPMRTAEECCAVLEQSTRIADIQTSAASSDTVVAVLLGEAAFHGAAANVEINMKDLADTRFVQETRARLQELAERTRLAAEKTMLRLGGSA